MRVRVHETCDPKHPFVDPTYEIRWESDATSFFHVLDTQPQRKLLWAQHFTLNQYHPFVYGVWFIN